MQDQITDLQGKLDAALKMRTSGAMPTGMKAENYADMIADQMSDDTFKRFALAIAKRYAALERQLKLETQAQTRGRKRAIKEQ